MLELTELKRLHDLAYDNSHVTRENAADDLVFWWVTQWDDNLLASTDLAYRGEFNIIRKAGRQIMADLRANPVQVDYEPVDDTDESASDLLDGLYRSDDRINSSQEAYQTGQQEAIVCGVGAWELRTEYQTLRGGNKNQVIRRYPIHESNNMVYWDPNSKLMDKSDADYVSVLKNYSKEAYEELAAELTGEEDYTASASNFKYPQESYAFPWITGDFEWVYITDFYHRELVKDKIIILADPFGDEKMVYESSLKDEMDTLLDSGYRIVSSKETERYIVTKYIASGERILKEERIAGEEIPIIPVYGERAVIESQEHWEGITRLAKDPQRLRNFVMSYMADVVAKSPRDKPIFAPQQIQKYLHMYELSGPDNNYPVLYQDIVDTNGKELPHGPVGVLPGGRIPESATQMLALTTEAAQDVAGNVVPKDFADIDLSGEALVQLNARIDSQSHVYQENMKHAKRRDAQVYSSMASEIYDVPRDVVMTLPDGTRKDARVMEQIVNEEGEIVVINDLRNAVFEVYSEIGPSYQSQKDKLRSEITQMMATTPQGSPEFQLFMLKFMELMDGVDTKDIREYARKQLIMMGLKEPETDEEKAMMEQMMAAQAQQGEQPNPMLMGAQAALMDAQSKIMREQRMGMKDQADVQNDQIETIAGIENDRANTAIKAYDAQTNRFKAGAEVQLRSIDQIGRTTKAMANDLRVTLNPQRA